MLPWTGAPSVLTHKLFNKRAFMSSCTSQRFCCLCSTFDSYQEHGRLIKRHMPRLRSSRLRAVLRSAPRGARQGDGTAYIYIYIYIYITIYILLLFLLLSLLLLVLVLLLCRGNPNSGSKAIPSRFGTGSPPARMHLSQRNSICQLQRHCEN